MAARSITSSTANSSQKVTVLFNSRRNRHIPATRRRRAVAAPAPVPQPPHAATEPTPTDLFAGGRQYDPTTIPGLYAEHRDLLASAERNERQANDVLADASERANVLLGLAARQRVQAADRLRLVKLAELDAVTPQGAVWPTPAPQIPQEPPALEHFSGVIGSHALCGSRSLFQTPNATLVTCPDCLTAMQSPGPEPRAAWSAHPSQDGDTERLPRIPAEVAR